MPVDPEQATQTRAAGVVPLDVENATDGRSSVSDVTARLEANRAAVEELIRVTGESASDWTTPRAKGKWSPSQVVEIHTRHHRAQMPTALETATAVETP